MQASQNKNNEQMLTSDGIPLKKSYQKLYLEVGLEPLVW